MRDFLATPQDTSGDGRYVHHVPHNINARFLEVRAIAFYKPQSSVPLKGSDDSGVLNNWTAISGAVPRYLGHYQPHIPDHLGYYDLRVPEVLRRQVELARQYGVYGFCFQYGQLSDVESLDLPLKQLLSDSNLEIPFCLSCDCDAISGSQEDSALLELLARIFADRRYIRIDDKPLLVLSGILSAADVESSRSRAPDMGLPGFYIVAVSRSDSNESPAMNVDAIVEDATGRRGVAAKAEFALIDPLFGGETYRYSEIMEKYSSTVHSSSVVFKNVVTGWDTEPLYPGNGCSFAEASPALYARWLDRCCRHTMSQRPAERFLFISSWNDWLVGA
ncbi:MAG TPA: glycoside hydrolase family 99-like domain-containing protein, partial [Terriglobia bacterium]|nr:glycoside hydrolase family 99-like domain-containing protein [Terriglobia bacterium]